MRIRQIVSSDKFVENHDYRSLLQIYIDDKREFDFLDGESEDSNLGRDFNDCYKIVNVIKQAFEAGKNGEKLEIESIEVDDFPV